MSIKVLTHSVDCPEWKVIESDKPLTLSTENDMETATQSDDVEPDGKTYHYLECLTSGKFYPIHIVVPSHDHLDWVPETLA